MTINIHKPNPWLLKSLTQGGKQVVPIEMDWFLWLQETVIPENWSSTPGKTGENDVIQENANKDVNDLSLHTHQNG